MNVRGMSNCCRTRSGASGDTRRGRHGLEWAARCQAAAARRYEPGPAHAVPDQPVQRTCPTVPALRRAASPLEFRSFAAVGCAPWRVSVVSAGRWGQRQGPGIVA